MDIAEVLRVTALCRCSALLGSRNLHNTARRNASPSVLGRGVSQVVDEGMDEEEVRVGVGARLAARDVAVVEAQDEEEKEAADGDAAAAAAAAVEVADRGRADA